MITHTLTTLPPLYGWILTGITAIAAILTATRLMRPQIAVGNHKPTEPTNNATSTPKVSVVVLSSGWEEELTDYLDALTAQDYPDFEIIVVSDSSSETREILAESCARRYRNVYVTFIPPGSHNLSRRKLAITLGMKAAKGKIVVTTVDKARIPSGNWLSRLTEPFRQYPGKIEISLGYSHMDFKEMHSGARWYREFDSVMTASQWIGNALTGNPYRGDGFNLAISRELFFRTKGYSRSIGVQGGDDDIYVHEVATPENTAVVLDPDTILTTQWGEASTRIWKTRKEQYNFTSAWLPQNPFFKSGLLSAMQWIIPALCGAIIALSLLCFRDNLSTDHSRMIEWLAMIPAALAVWGGFLLTEIIIYRRAAARLEATRLWWALPWFLLFRPILNFLFRLRHREK